jgi:hypothetical protein
MPTAAVARRTVLVPEALQTPMIAEDI